jgi:predicted DNA binding CopG/RHH family protein
MLEDGGSNMAKRNEAEEITKTTIRLPKALILLAKHRALDNGEDFQDVVRRALEQYLSKKRGQQ